MGKRILTFHRTEPVANQVRMSPSAFYMEADYTPIAVRLYAEQAPVRDAKFDIFDDGVSIFNNSTLKQYEVATGRDITGTADTTVKLPANQNSDEIAEDFATNCIDEGSWVYCNLVDAGGGRNFTVELELFTPDEDVEDE